jgi:hypothetical protein
MPRSWLAGLAALFAVPWLALGAVYVADRARDGAPASAGRTPAGVEAGQGPWGRLALSPIVISPPIEYVSIDFGPLEPPVWRFPSAPLQQVEAFLASAGLPPDVIARVRASARPDPATNGVVAAPDPELLRSFSPAVRARIYTVLARTPLNAPQAHSYRFHGESASAWLDGGPISPATRQLVEPLIYSDGGFQHFADLGLVRASIDDEDELRALAKVLSRQSTVLIRLSVPTAGDVPALAEYWGRGGRRTDLHPLLESVAGREPDRSVDVLHLLPVFARNHLYRYPRLTAADFDRPVIANCLWSSLNFFSDAPDDRYLDVDTALATLKRDYFIIEDAFQLGDIVAFLDAQGNIFHAAVHIADGLLFTKNGTSPMAPWTIMSTEAVKGYYRSRAAEPRLMYHRRKGL